MRVLCQYIAVRANREDHELGKLKLFMCPQGSLPGFSARVLCEGSLRVSRINKQSDQLTAARRGNLPREETTTPPGFSIVIAN